jgi:hypothetical protein
MSNTAVEEKDLTANQLYKNYKDEGGTLKFSDWLTREKTKGIFPLNGSLNENVQETLKTVKEKEMKKTYLGFPVSTFLIAGGIIVLAVVVAKIVKKK